MKIINEKDMQRLSFPDFDIEKIELNLKEKKIKIFVEGAWLDIDDGCQLGNGILYFNDWENLSISSYDPQTQKWSYLHELAIESLKDICEMKFDDSGINLCGFDKKTGHWMEMKLDQVKMHAEFES